MLRVADFYLCVVLRLLFLLAPVPEAGEALLGGGECGVDVARHAAAGSGGPIQRH